MQQYKKYKGESAMSDYIKKRMAKLKVTDEGIIKWANANGYDSLLPGNIGMVRQIYIDAHDEEELEFPDLEMRGKRVTVAGIPSEEWVILRVFMFKIARTTTYPMCPEDGCYARVSNSECQARGDKSHGYVADPTKGIRQYYFAGDGGEEGEGTYVIVPAKYAMKGYNFEKQWCDVKGIWNDTLEGFFANLIMPLSKEEMEKGGIDTPTPTSKPEVEEGDEIVELPKGLDLTAFTKKPLAEEKAEAEPVSEADAVFQAELKNFQQIIPFFPNYLLSQFDTFIESNDIKTPIAELVKATPGCRIEGEGEAAKVIYEKPA
jgi:hypothetical protein